MALKPAKCPSCGANLEIDEERKKAFCTFCGTPFIVEDAIRNYYIQNTVHVGRVETMNLNTDLTANAKIEAGEAFLKLHKYQNAKDSFEEAMKIKPQDPRGYWGKIQALTKEFETCVSENWPANTLIEHIYTLETTFKEMLIFTPDNRKNEFKTPFIKYLEDIRDDLNSSIKNIKERISGAQKKYADLESAKKSASKLNIIFSILFGLTFIPCLFFLFWIIMSIIDKDNNMITAGLILLALHLGGLVLLFVFKELKDSAKNKYQADIKKSSGEIQELKKQLEDKQSANRKINSVILFARGA